MINGPSFCSFNIQNIFFCILNVFHVLVALLLNLKVKLVDVGGLLDVILKDFFLNHKLLRSLEEVYHLDASSTGSKIILATLLKMI